MFLKARAFYELSPCSAGRQFVECPRLHQLSQLLARG
jgi:hypothetical protein